MPSAGSLAALSHPVSGGASIPCIQCNLLLRNLHFLYTAVLRSLGIPSRPITNFASAHDTDANRAIDFYFDSSYEEIPHMSADSIW